jgi:hypothetical protein
MEHDLEDLRRQARQRLVRCDELRAAMEFLHRGLTPRDVADLLSISEAQAGRLLKAAARHGPILQPEPEEIILRAFIDGTGRRELVETLKAFQYTFSQEAPPPHEGRLPGTWDQVVAAHAQGLLSSDEFDEIRTTIDFGDKQELRYRAAIGFAAALIWSKSDLIHTT